MTECARLKSELADTKAWLADVLASDSAHLEGISAELDGRSKADNPYPEKPSSPTDTRYLSWILGYDDSATDRECAALRAKVAALTPEWRNRPPTPAEVIAHGTRYPERSDGRGVPTGHWLVRRRHDPVLPAVTLGTAWVSNGKVLFGSSGFVPIEEAAWRGNEWCPVGCGETLGVCVPWPIAETETTGEASR